MNLNWIIFNLPDNFDKIQLIELLNNVLGANVFTFSYSCMGKKTIDTS